MYFPLVCHQGGHTLFDTGNAGAHDAFRIHTHTHIHTCIHTYTHSLTHTRPRHTALDAAPPYACMHACMHTGLFRNKNLPYIKTITRFMVQKRILSFIKGDAYFGIARCMHAYIHTSMTYVYVGGATQIRLPTDVCTYLPIYLPTYLPTYLHI